MLYPTLSFALYEKVFFVPEKTFKQVQKNKQKNTQNIFKYTCYV